MKLMPLLFLLALPVAEPSPSAPAVNEFWISPRTPTTVGVPLGTSANPLDGSTCSNFDHSMQSLPPHSTIHLLPGTYQTMGGYGWGPKTGQHLLGSGMDVTVLQFPAAAVASGACFNDSVIAVQSPYWQTNVTVSDLTLDCNYQPGTLTTLNGISLVGSGNTIERVKLINAASFTSARTNYFEAWGIIIGAWPFNDACGNRIENCVVSGYKCNFGNNLSALGLLENSSGIIAHNFITQDGTNYVFGIYPGSHDSVVDGNILQNVVVGSHYDSGTGATNDTFINNKFINCSCAIDWYGACFQDNTFQNNSISLTNDGSGRFSTEAFFFHPEPSVFKNITIFGNTVRVAGTNHFPNQRFILAYNAHGLLIQNNRVDAHLPSLFVHHSGIVMNNNYDLDGNPSGPLMSTPLVPRLLGAAPGFMQSGAPLNTIFIWCSNNVPPTTYGSYYDTTANQQTKWSQ